MAEPMLPRAFRVLRKRREFADTVTLDLESADGEALRFAAGQFNMLYAFGVGEVPISIAGDPCDGGRLVHTVRTVGAVTRAIAQLKKGGVLGVRGPYGSVWPVDAAEGRDLIVVAGGIGLAPLRPVMLQALAQRKRFGRVVLLYGTRSSEDLLYRRELERWSAHLDVEVHVTVDRAGESWMGDVGVVTRLVPKLSIDAERAVAMVCGPEVMMRFAAFELEKRGLSAERIFVSIERNMKCGVGLCGHCQWGPTFVCKDGPIFPYSRVQRLLKIWEL
jgi:NAD(P)H-flavin reductase